MTLLIASQSAVVHCPAAESWWETFSLSFCVQQTAASGCACLKCVSSTDRTVVLVMQISQLKSQPAATHSEIDANAAKVADAASVHSQIDWLHSRLQSSMDVIQVGAWGS